MAWWDDIGKAIQQTATNVVKTVQSVTTNVANTVQSIPTNVAKTIVNVETAVFTTAQSVGSAVGGAVQFAAAHPQDILEDVGGGVLTAVGAVVPGAQPLLVVGAGLLAKGISDTARDIAGDITIAQQKTQAQEQAKVEAQAAAQEQAKVQAQEKAIEQKAAAVKSDWTHAFIN